MRVLVTGGAGYIGSVTSRHLIEAGHECVVLDDLSRGHAEAVDPRASFVRGSVGDQDAVGEALEGCSAVIHMAGFIDVEESQRKPQLYMHVNCELPSVMLDVMKHAAVRQLVFSSTAAVYGEPDSVPIPEDAPSRPINAYGASKLAFEREVERREPEGLRCIRFRYFNVAGAMGDASAGEAHDPETHIVPRVLLAMRDGRRRFEVFGGDYPTRDGTCVRDYIHVCDLARAHVRAVEALADGGAGAVFNLGNGNGYTNREVVETCARVTGVEVDVVTGQRREGDPAVLVASSERARTELGWVPEYPELERMVDDAWRWHTRAG